MRSRAGLGIAALIAATTLAACGNATATGTVTPKPSPGPVQHGSVMVAGQARTYRLFRPTSLDPHRPSPLVLNLHPCVPGSDGNGAAAFTHFDDVASAGRFIVAYPDGIGGCWNADARPGMPNDVAFFGALLDRLTADRSIDKRRILVTGVSGGAAMSYRLACEMSDRILGIASVSGTMLDDTCQPSRPVSVLEMHGTLDFYDGGGPINAPAVPAVMQRWVAFDGCIGHPVETQSGITKTSTWTQCKAGTVVRLDTVVGGHHTWFGSPFDPVPGEPNANDVVWSFLSGLQPTTG